MSKIEEHADLLIRTVGSLVRSLYGKKANLIVIPIIEVDEGIELAIMSTMGKEKTSSTLVEAAIQAIKIEDHISNCPKCKSKEEKSKGREKAEVVDILGKKDIH